MDKWQVTIKGYWPEEKQKDGIHVTDIYHGYRTIDFEGSKHELDIYLDDLISSVAAKIQIISITNLNELMIEISKTFDYDNRFTGKAKITDCYNHKSYITDYPIALNLFAESQKKSIEIYLATNPSKRFFMDKEAFKYFIELYKCKHL
jgi:hypothetical protein